MATLDSAIDDVYKVPLEGFVSARTTLAKSLKGEDAKRVKGLSKPTVVPWAVNQVYWHARPTYDGVTKTGEKLRAAQIAALNGRSADLRTANTAHRAAVGDAVKAAARLASAQGVRPDADALARMFEAVSLTTSPPEPHGRFTKPLQPAGFEALSGLQITSAPRPGAGRDADPAVHEKHAPAAIAQKQAPAAEPTRREALHAAAQEKRARDAERERQAAEQRKQAAVRNAESDVSRARAVEARAREAWDRAKQALDDAERALERALE